MTCAATTDDWRVQYRGDTWRIPVAVFDDGAPENLVGTELWFTLKVSLSDPDPGVLQRRFLVPSSPAAVAGVSEIPVPAELTDQVQPRSYHYDVQRIRPGAVPDVRTIESGQFRVIFDVTRAITPGPVPAGAALLLPHVDADAIETAPQGTSWLFLNELGLLRLLRSDGAVEPIAQGGGSDSTTYTQASPATQWQINHGFGRPVSVTVYADDGVQIFPTVTQISGDAILITHAMPQAGTALIL